MFFQFKFRDKSNLYSRLLLFVFFILVIVLLTSESAFILGNSIVGPKIGGTLVSFLMIGLFIYSIELMSVIGLKNKRIKKVLYAFAIIGSFTGLYIANPFVDVLSYHSKQVIYSFFHILNLSLFSIIGAYIIIDIFSSRETHTDHIWGAIVVYFLIIFLFGEIYELITLQLPGLLGTKYEIGWPNYIQCTTYSMNAISGIDSAYPNAHSLIKKLSVLENILGNLFLIVILGRLLSHPLNKKM